jgi:hypothetical protein
MEMTAFAAQATMGLFADGPDMAKLLAAVTLCKICMCSVCFNLDNDMTEASQFENFLRFLIAFEHDNE